jgi:hypothetical protein
LYAEPLTIYTVVRIERTSSKEDFMATKKFTPEEARERKNARQREYAKRTGYKASAESMKKNVRRVVLNLSNNTDADIIKWLESKDNMMGYMKELIREDMQRNQ